MNKLFIFNSILFFSINLYAWEFGVKADLQRASTNNVDLSSTGAVSDTYSTYGGYVQVKDNVYKIKLKAKAEKYKLRTVNDNNTFDLSLQYKPTKHNDYTFAVFKQTYNGVTATSTDTASDNNGGRFSATFSKDFDKKTSGYFILNGTAKKYTKIANRNDKIIGASIGLEHYKETTLLINPELLAASNNSTDAYYKNFFYGPSLLISYTPNDNWEIYVDGSISFTKYSGRIVSTISNKGKVVNEKEHQELASGGIGAIYTIADKFPLEVKYTTSQNSSNNSTSAYKAQILSFNIGMKL